MFDRNRGFPKAYEQKTDVSDVDSAQDSVAKGSKTNAQEEHSFYGGKEDSE